MIVKNVACIRLAFASLMLMYRAKKSVQSFMHNAARLSVSSSVTLWVVYESQQPVYTM